MIGLMDPNCWIGWAICWTCLFPCVRALRGAGLSASTGSHSIWVGATARDGRGVGRFGMRAPKNGARYNHHEIGGVDQHFAKRIKASPSGLWRKLANLYIR